MCIFIVFVLLRTSTFLFLSLLHVVLLLVCDCLDVKILCLAASNLPKCQCMTIVLLGCAHIFLKISYVGNIHIAVSEWEQ